jgi:hypothetical protein
MSKVNMEMVFGPLKIQERIGLKSPGSNKLREIKMYDSIIKYNRK